MPRKQPPEHMPNDFELDILSSDSDMFKWFLLCYLFGKPIRSETAVDTWRIVVEKGFDTAIAIEHASDRELVRMLNRGGYTRYQHVTARGLRICMEQLDRLYEGSLYMMIENSFDEDEFSKRLRELHGVGPKVAEIFMRGTEELFARRVE